MPKSNLGVNIYNKHMFHYVYLTTDLNSGKQYVGDHSTLNAYDKYLGSGILIGNAIKKYGKENFKKEILEEFNSKEEAFLAQEKYILQYNTIKPFGYNLSPTGGIGVKNSLLDESKLRIAEAMRIRVVSSETRQRMSASKKGVKPWNIGIPHTEEAKQAMSKTKKELESGKGIKNSMFNKEPFDIWQEKYGVEEALIRKKNLYEKRSNLLLRKECEFCHKIVPLNIFNRCHGVKCKTKFV